MNCILKLKDVYDYEMVHNIEKEDGNFNKKKKSVTSVYQFHSMKEK